MLNPSVRAVEWGECFMWWPSLMVDFGQFPSGANWVVDAGPMRSEMGGQ